MKKLFSLLFCGALLLTGCAYAALANQPNTYELYFREADLKAAVGSDALRAETIQLEEEAESTDELAEVLLQKLLEGPAEESLRSTIPVGTALLSLKVEMGQAVVDLSAPYATLSGVALTLADYAITLTLTQLEEISSVKITVLGQELAYREKQVFQTRDVLLSPKEDVVGTIQVQLYFLDGEGNLQPEERTLDLFEGDTQVGAVARALELGPETKGLSAIFPEGFRVRNLWMEEQTCYINFSSVLLGYLLEENEQVIEALCRSLCSLESVSEVRFLVDGEFYENYQGISLGTPFVE